MKYIYVVYCLFLLISCQNNKQEYQDIEEIPMASTFDPLEAKKLMETHCYLCHSPSAPENQGRIAPPMVAIKARYIDREGFNKAEFI